MTGERFASNIIAKKASVSHFTGESRDANASALPIPSSEKNVPPKNARMVIAVLTKVLAASSVLKMQQNKTPSAADANSMGAISRII